MTTVHCQRFNELESDPPGLALDDERTIVEVFSSEGEEMFRGEAECREGSLRFDY